MTSLRRDDPQERAALPDRERPHRPVLVEVAAAFLIIDGLIATITSLDLAGRLADQVPGIEPLALLTIALGIATVALGVLVRYGHAWLVTLNVAAVAGFLELTAGSPAGLLTGAVDVMVVLILLWTRPWFTWSADEDEEADGPDEGR